MESAFQFTNPALTYIEFNINPNFNTKYTEVQIKHSISVNITKNNDQARVSLICEIGEKNESCPFWIKAEEQADFKWNIELNSELVDKLLNQNAPSLLLSYLRPVIAQVTMSSPFGAYNIPFINFTKNNNH